MTVNELISQLNDMLNNGSVRPEDKITIVAESDGHPFGEYVTKAYKTNDVYGREVVAITDVWF